MSFSRCIEMSISLRVMAASLAPAPAKDIDARRRRRSAPLVSRRSSALNYRATEKRARGAPAMNVSLAQASKIVEVALATGRSHNFAALTVAVLDAGGHLVSLMREDRSGL